MFVVQARYRGRARRRAEFVQKSAEALSTLPGGGDFEVIGVEEIVAAIETPQGVCDTIMALLSAGDWAVACVVFIDDEATDTLLDEEDVVTEKAFKFAASTLGAHARSGSVKAGVKINNRKNVGWGNDIQSVFTMISHILAKRTAEGREATSLVRSGLNQNEAAQELGISKQAMSQRLQAAGWQAELAGYHLAISLLRRVSRAES